MEFFRRQIAGSLSVPPASMVHDEMMVSFASATAAMQATTEAMNRATRALDIGFSDVMRGMIGLPPISAVDRLARLVEEPDGT